MWASEILPQDTSRRYARSSLLTTHRSDCGTRRIVAASDIIPFTAIAYHYLIFLVAH